MNLKTLDQKTFCDYPASWVYNPRRPESNPRNSIAAACLEKGYRSAWALTVSQEEKKKPWRRLFVNFWASFLFS